MTEEHIWLRMAGVCKRRADPEGRVLPENSTSASRLVEARSLPNLEEFQRHLDVTFLLWRERESITHRHVVGM